MINKENTQIGVKSWNMIDAHKVVVSTGADEKGKTTALFNINDGEVIHQFGPESRVTKALAFTPESVMAERFIGGKFFVLNEQLTDFRDNHYNGFTHSNDSIQRLIDTIGVSQRTGHRGIKHHTTQGNVMLSNIWGDTNLDIEEYKDGGQFSSRLRYNWSPFSQNIRGVFELVRLICTNGMVGLTDFFNAKIPMINRWEEHMDIAYGQIQNKVQGRVKSRIRDMGTERATVGELLQIVSHASNRLKSATLIDHNERERLNNISMIADPRIHLNNIYQPGVFDDKAIASRLVGHMTAFDAWNLVTEMYSHTQSSDSSSDVGLQRMANALVFDGEQRNKRIINVGKGPRLLSSFSSPETAFYGVMN